MGQTEDTSRTRRITCRAEREHLVSKGPPCEGSMYLKEIAAYVARRCLLAMSRAGLVSAVLEDSLEGVWWITQSCSIPVVS